MLYEWHIFSTVLLKRWDFSSEIRSLNAIFSIITTNYNLHAKGIWVLFFSLYLWVCIWMYCQLWIQEPPKCYFKISPGNSLRNSYRSSTNFSWSCSRVPPTFFPDVSFREFFRNFFRDFSEVLPKWFLEVSFKEISIGLLPEFPRKNLLGEFCESF